MIHAFQKRSRKGIATSQRDVDLARDRIKRLKAQLMTGDLERSLAAAMSPTSGKPRACSRIIGALDERELSTRRAAKLTGFAAADFSRVRNADGRFTLDRLIRILHALDQPVEVAVTVRPRDEPLPVSTQP
jgi:predicted XRE-type DNA-binding protein